jgi:hypothetical protein
MDWTYSSDGDILGRDVDRTGSSALCPMTGIINKAKSSGYGVRVWNFFFFFQTRVRKDCLFRLHFVKFMSNINNSSADYQPVAE